jgi:hypothetical protein
MKASLSPFLWFLLCLQLVCVIRGQDCDSVSPPDCENEEGCTEDPESNGEDCMVDDSDSFDNSSSFNDSSDYSSFDLDNDDETYSPIDSMDHHNDSWSSPDDGEPSATTVSEDASSDDQWPWSSFSSTTDPQRPSTVDHESDIDPTDPEENAPFATVFDNDETTMVDVASNNMADDNDVNGHGMQEVDANPMQSQILVVVIVVASVALIGAVIVALYLFKRRKSKNDYDGVQGNEGTGRMKQTANNTERSSVALFDGEAGQQNIDVQCDSDDDDEQMSLAQVTVSAKTN